MGLKERFLFLHEHAAALKPSLQKNLQPHCTFLGLINDSILVIFFKFFYQKAEREKELKCFLLKTLVQALRAADTVLSDNQDKTARVSLLFQLFPVSLFPDSAHVEFPGKGSKLSSGATLSSPS